MEANKILTLKFNANIENNYIELLQYRRLEINEIEDTHLSSSHKIIIALILFTEYW